MENLSLESLGVALQLQQAEETESLVCSFVEPAVAETSEWLDLFHFFQAVTGNVQFLTDLSIGHCT